jgi:vitamin B12 transporter
MNVGDRLHLSFGARYDGASEGQGFLTGRATAVYDIPETETRLRASLGTGAKRPTFYQLDAPIYGNPALADETSIGADAGIDQTLFDGRLQLSATAYYNHFDNLIDFDFGTFTFQNVTEAETAGTELSASAGIVPGKLSATASYTYLYSRDLKLGLPLQRNPTNSASLALTYTGIEKLSTTVSATYVGARYNDSAATQLLPGYTRVDLDATYQLNDKVSLFGKVVNLLNATYQDPLTYNTAGLSAYIGLKSEL